MSVAIKVTWRWALVVLVYLACAVRSADAQESRLSDTPPSRPETKSTQELLSALSSDKQETRLAAHQELVACGKRVIPDVLKHIESGASIERFYGVFAALGPEAEAALPILTAQLNKKDHVIHAAVTMHRIKPGAVAALAEDTKQKMAASLYEAIVDPKADEIAAFGAVHLVTIGKPAAPTILRLLQHKDAKYRAMAAEALTSARFVDERIEAELAKLAQGDGDHEVRVAAASALGATGEPTPPAKAALLSIIKNPPPPNPGETREERSTALRAWRHIADHAARSLARLGPGAIDDLIPLLSPLDAPSRVPAITALENIGAPAVPRLIDLLATKDQSVAISAGIALNRMGQPAVPGLATAVSTGNEQVVDHAANALWWIGPGAKSALPNLLQVVGSERRSDTSRLAAARAVLKIDPTSSRKSDAIRSAIPILIRTLENGSFEHQGWAAEALGGIGAPARAALPILRKRLALPDEKTNTGGLVRDYVQRAAREAITAIEADVATGSAKPD